MKRDAELHLFNGEEHGGECVENEGPVEFSGRVVEVIVAEVG